MVALYFGLSFIPNQGTAAGIATLYNNDYGFYPNNGIFDGQSFLDIMKVSALTTGGSYQSALIGNIELVGITQKLQKTNSNNIP